MTKNQALRRAPSLIAAILAAVAMCSGCRQARVPDRVIIPAEGRGWYRICFDVRGAPELPQRDGFRVIEFRESHLLETSTRAEYGSASDEFYFRQPFSELLPISQLPRGSEVAVREEYMSNYEDREPCLTFFVGSSADLVRTPDPWAVPRPYVPK